MTRVIISILFICSHIIVNAIKEIGTIDYKSYIFSLNDQDYKITDTTGQMIILSKGGKMGFANFEGELIQLPQFDLVYPFKTTSTVVVLNNKYGIISNKGKVILACEYEKIEPFNCSVTAYQKDNRWGIVSNKGKFVLAPHFYYINNISEGIAICKTINNKLIMVDANGRTIDSLDNNTFRFEDFAENYQPQRKFMSIINKPVQPYEFKNGIAVGIDKETGKYCYVNKRNTPLFGKTFLKLRPFENGLACVKTAQGWNIIDLNGNYILKKWYSTISLSDEFITVSENDLYGVLDLKGQEIIPIKHKRVTYLGNEIFAFCPKDKWGVINAHNEVILKPRYEGLDYDPLVNKGRAGVYEGSNSLNTGIPRYNYWGHYVEFNDSGKVSNEKHHYGMTVEGIADWHSEYFDLSGNHLTFAPELNKHQYGYSTETTSVKMDNPFGSGSQTSHSLIEDVSGNIIIKEISHVEFYPNCMIIKDVNQNSIILDLLGKELFRANNAYISHVEGGLFSIYNEGKHYVINARGEEIKLN